MDKAFQIILDFVEGRLPAKEFEQVVYNDPSLERTLKDDSLRWHGTYIKSDPYDYLIGLDYDDPGGRLNAQGAMEMFLQRKGVLFQSDRAASDLHSLLMAAQPKWLDVDTAYLAKRVLPDAGSRTGRELRDWLRVRLEQLFRYHRKPPKWIQSPAWPITENGPMYFFGQINLDNCEHFHDEAAAYLFFDPKTRETRTVIQVF
jgi:hypothetical protein